MKISIQEWQVQLDNIDYEVEKLKRKKRNLIRILKKEKKLDYRKGKLIKQIKK